jgi:hypothetical protein
MRDGESVLCFNFWVMSRLCKAKILIHEAAHAVGIGSGKTLPQSAWRGVPVRRHPAQQGPDGRHPIGQPDACAYFAAHVWRDIDMECIQFFGEIIDIRSTKDALPVTREKKDEGRK